MYLDVAFDAPRTIGRVGIYGNREYQSGYDVLTARLELFDGVGTRIFTQDVTTDRDAEPNGNADVLVSPPRACVASMRLILLTSEGAEPGIAEIQAFRE